MLSAITLAPAPAKGAECAEAGAGAAAVTNITIDAAAADAMEEGAVVEEVDEEGGGDADNETDGSPVLPGTPVVRDVGSFVGQVDHPACVHGCVYAWMYVCARMRTNAHACSRMLTHAHACMCAMNVWQVELVPGLEHVLGLRPCPPSQPCSKVRPLNPRHRRVSANLRVSLALYLSLAPAPALSLSCVLVCVTESMYVSGRVGLRPAVHHHIAAVPRTDPGHRASGLVCWSGLVVAGLRTCSCIWFSVGALVSQGGTS